FRSLAASSWRSLCFDALYIYLHGGCDKCSTNRPPMRGVHRLPSSCSSTASRERCASAGKGKGPHLPTLPCVLVRYPTRTLQRPKGRCAQDGVRPAVIAPCP